MASLIVLPTEWTSTMSVLQDKCDPSSYEDLQTLFLNDMEIPLEELFDEFDTNPVGVASLAQVHVARHRPSGRKVAVKVSLLVLSYICFSEWTPVATSSSRSILRRGHGHGGCYARYSFPYSFSQ